VDTQSGSVSSVEALVRWNNPQRGQLLPATFIPVAEDMGLIVPLGEWVLNVACQQTARWHREGFGRIRVAVNLSPAQFRTKGLQAAVEHALEVSKLPADCLELELTESILMADVDGSVEILRGLTQLGVTVAVDDFGVGYSSLTQLKRFPVSTLKIDQSFVRDMVASADDGAIVAATIALGHSLRLNVIAEGVESAEQLDFLRDHDCDESQGFLFSAPVSGPDLEMWLREKTDAHGDDARAEAG
jgi:EAL domain-containing protein (putative c-di-GMP-specific phosphodiesterase class I)